MSSINNNSNGAGLNPSHSIRNRANESDKIDQSSKFHFYSSSEQNSNHSRYKGIFGGLPPKNSSNEDLTGIGGSSSGEGDDGDAKKKLGTLDGVLLPTLQTILGVILFLRLPSITAQAGCVNTTIIILICVTSTLITAISLSAIATNGKIQAGGPYYVISRTLGREVGGALGLLFYLGTTMACAMSVLGAVEAVLRSLGDSIESQADLMHDQQENTFVDIGDNIGLGRRFLQNEYDVGSGDGLTLGGQMETAEEEIVHEIDHQLENGLLVQLGTQYLSLMLAMALTVFVSVGFRVVDMASNLFLAIMFLSIFCSVLGCILFATGHHLGDLIPWDRLFMDNVWPHYTPDPNTGITPDFFSCLALFYPSVTGKYVIYICIYMYVRGFESQYYTPFLVTFLTDPQIFTVHSKRYSCWSE
jgi:amino acid transporter